MRVDLWIKAAFARFGLQVQRPQRQFWENDPLFSALLKEAQSRSLVDATRLFLLYQYALQAAAAAGDAAEVGVYKGGSARLLAKTLEGSGKTLRLFDTFSGMPAVDPGRDAHRPGDFADTSEREVRRYLSDCPNAAFYPGLFPETAKPLENSRFCFAHVDVDIYRSALDCCRFFYPRLSAGGVMVFDDYGAPMCHGAQQAVDEFFADKPERPLRLPTGQCAVIKK